MATQPAAVLGILGGSGVYSIDGLAGARWEKVESPFGAPSDELLQGELAGRAWPSCRATAAATGSPPARSTTARTSTR